MFFNDSAIKSHSYLHRYNHLSFFIHTFHSPAQMSIYLVEKPNGSWTGMGVGGFYGRPLPALAVPSPHKVPSARKCSWGTDYSPPTSALGVLLHNVPYQALSQLEMEHPEEGGQSEMPGEMLGCSKPCQRSRRKCKGWWIHIV